MGTNMAKDRIRYLLFLSGRWRWRPTRQMRKLGFQLITFGPVLSGDDKAVAVGLNEEWDKVRAGLVAQPEETYPPGSVGDGYERAMKMRAAERKAKGTMWTKEQESRDDWARAWKWIGPVFGDVDPNTIQSEHFLAMDQDTGKVRGVLPLVESKVSISERHRVIKVWRALWKRMAVMHYCDSDKDPSLAFANSAPPPRQEVWSYREALRLVRHAWKLGYKGLAA